ncbi:MAG: hypothetical protein AB3N23_22905 [Paracoccaceae bacterium]
MAEAFSLKDHLFNAETLGQLAGEFEAGVPGFDGARFVEESLSRFDELGLLERMEWMADCLEPQLPGDFPAMAEALEAAMPPPLDPSLKDDDFGHFIHAMPGILAVRHGLEDHRERALDLLHAATQRFSMEFYIRPFLNRWTKEVLARMEDWVEDDNYHVRRLVSEGTRPKLPWAKAVTIGHAETLPLLDRLHGDGTRYVTRSVANHLNDIAKIEPDLVVGRLEAWQDEGRQGAKELGWMTRHALRTLVKGGHGGALRLLGFDPEAAVEVVRFDVPGRATVGEKLPISVALRAGARTPVIVDYVFWRRRSSGELAPKVHKLKQVVLKSGEVLKLEKAHHLKGDATTYSLFPGPQRIDLQINGRIVAEAPFELLAQ